MILLDTHAAVWLANDNPALGPNSRLIALAARDENQLAISAISFWEMALLVSKDRIEIRYRPAELRVELRDTGIVELALTGDIRYSRLNLRICTATPPTVLSSPLPWRTMLRSSQRTLGCCAGVAR